MDLITLLAAKFAEEGCYRLLIVDSIMALFRTDYSGRGELSERQQRLNQMLSRLTRIAEEFHVAVLLVNQVQSDPGGGMAFAAAEKKVRWAGWKSTSEKMKLSYRSLALVYPLFYSTASWRTRLTSCFYHSSLPQKGSRRRKSWKSSVSFLDRFTLTLKFSRLTKVIPDLLLKLLQRQSRRC